MTSLLAKACGLTRRLHTLAAYGETPLLLAIRLWMGEIFLQSGWNKLQNYLNGDPASTEQLFEYVHPVPHLPAEIAAPLATGGEVILGGLFALGLLGRFAAAGLLVMTVVIQMAMPQINTHALWMLLFAVIMVRGPGWLSLDRLVTHLWCRRKTQ